jgi:hypothetical protein
LGAPRKRVPELVPPEVAKAVRYRFYPASGCRDLVTVFVEFMGIGIDVNEHRAAYQSQCRVTSLTVFGHSRPAHGCLEAEALGFYNRRQIRAPMHLLLGHPG